jgi:hypothetical protein
MDGLGDSGNRRLVAASVVVSPPPGGQETPNTERAHGEAANGETGEHPSPNVLAVQRIGRRRSRQPGSDDRPPPDAGGAATPSSFGHHPRFTRWWAQLGSFFQSFLIAAGNNS